MSGAQRGAAAALLRAGMATAEPIYASVAAVRNKLFDANVKAVRRLPRPVVSVGNITAGGTGKTPMVRWIASALRDEGRTVAVLSRGYGAAAAGELGDELTMLGAALNGPGRPPVLLRANPDRHAAGAALLAEHPAVDVLLLDDGFQHRRLARDLDVVLINATEPFGFDHVLPRGLLREPLRGLRRAGAIVLTRADRVGEDALLQIESRIRQLNPSAPIYRTAHVQTGFRSPGRPTHEPPDETMGSLVGRKWFVFSGIGSPDALRAQLESHGGTCVGSRAFSDHHAYGAQDVLDLRAAAARAKADVLITTEKDWVKIEPHVRTAAADGVPVWRVDVEIRFLGGDGAAELFLEQVRQTIADGGGDRR